jgi:hypothetical protein
MYTAYFLSLSALSLYVQGTLGYVGNLVPSFGDASLLQLSQVEPLLGSGSAYVPSCKPEFPF